MRTADYSTYFQRVAGLIGVAASDVQADEQTILKNFFNDSIQDSWERTNWLDLTQIGEARFVGNQIPYANAYTASASSWTKLAATATDNVLGNPADGRVTAGSLIETVANSEHYIQTPTIKIVPNVDYVFSAFLAAAGRTYARLMVTIGVTTYYAFFQLTGNGTVVSQTNCTGSIGAMANGFYKVSISITSATTTPTTCTAQTALSSDGSTTSYAGDGVSGVYLWGQYLGPITVPAQGQIISFEQTGEIEIEAPFAVWRNSPVAVNFPTAAPYILVPDGIQLIGPGTSWNTGSVQQPAGSNMGNPVFVDYRRAVPNFIGADYSALSTYAIGETVLFTNTAGVSNYYQCFAATSAGQSPVTNPTKWTLLEIPLVLLDYCVHHSYAQWLRVEGRTGAAEVADQRADEQLMDEFDRQERQLGVILPMKVQTHVTAQAR